MEIQPVPVNLILDGRETRELVAFLNTVRNLLAGAEGYGTTADRPVDPRLGQLYYDSTLGAQVVCTTLRVGGVPAVWSLV